MTKATIEVNLDGSALDAAERALIVAALRASGGSTSIAARMIGCSVRKVQYRLSQWGVPLPHGKARDRQQAILEAIERI